MQQTPHFRRIRTSVIKTACPHKFSEIHRQLPILRNFYVICLSWYQVEHKPYVNFAFAFSKNNLTSGIKINKALCASHTMISQLAHTFEYVFDTCFWALNLKIGITNE